MINDAVYKWNVTDISTGRVTSGGDFKIYSDDYGNVSWAGKCWYPCIPNLLVGYKIKLNEYALGTDGYYAINVTLHELGHMYGLDHSSNEYSVMKPVANPDILYPNTDDKNGVNSIY